MMKQNTPKTAAVTTATTTGMMMLLWFCLPTDGQKARFKEQETSKVALQGPVQSHASRRACGTPKTSFHPGNWLCRWCRCGRPPPWEWWSGWTPPRSRPARMVCAPPWLCLCSMWAEAHWMGRCGGWNRWGCMADPPRPRWKCSSKVYWYHLRIWRAGTAGQCWVWGVGGCWKWQKKEVVTYRGYVIGHNLSPALFDPWWNSTGRRHAQQLPSFPRCSGFDPGAPTAVCGPWTSPPLLIRPRHKPPLLSLFLDGTRSPWDWNCQSSPQEVWMNRESRHRMFSGHLGILEPWPWPQ